MVHGNSLIVCFLDESETDANTPHAVLGGITMNRKELPEFDSRWNQMLAAHRLPDGLHMIDLGPNGKYPHLVGDACAAMLTEAVDIINDCRIATFVAPLNNRTHKTVFSSEIRDINFSVYFFAFLMAVVLNQRNAEGHGCSEPIDYILDEGNRFKEHIVAIKEVVASDPQFDQYKIGIIDFGTDSKIPALQAADVIAWSARRRNAGLQFGSPHHTPLQKLFSGAFIDPYLPADALVELSASLSAALASMPAVP